MKPVVLALFLVGIADAFFTGGPLPHRCVALRRGSPLAEGPSPLVAPLTDAIWDICPPVRVEGNTLKTWDFDAESAERVQLSIQSSGRPMEANVEVWQSPSYVPTKFTVECEDGSETPVHTIIEIPNRPVTIAVYNTECSDFPFEASVADTGLGKAEEVFAGVKPDLVQGGKVKSYAFGPEVESVQVLLKTDLRDMKAMIEILQGPNDDNEIIELDSTVGHMHPFYTVIQTPGRANTLRIVNKNSVEFPFDAYVLPCEISSDKDASAVVGGAWGW